MLRSDIGMEYIFLTCNGASVTWDLKSTTLVVNVIVYLHTCQSAQAERKNFAPAYAFVL